MNTPNVRCCNLDWLEVYCLEPIDYELNAEFFRSHNIEVHERDYGTRVYREMFVIYTPDGQPFCEIRRKPVGTDTGTSILPVNACHVRLVNRQCYFNDAAMRLQQFLDAYGYNFQRISRLDVCLDFEKFDTGQLPAKFLRNYLKGTYRKINQSRIHVHGNDTWSGQDYNSASWGSHSSQVSTKIYNKSMELREVKDKPYIKWAWFECGLIDHPIECYKVGNDGTRYYPDIWRLEFSISSSVKNWYTIEEDGKSKNYHSFRHDLYQWANREKCLDKFFSLVPHYFRFKYYEPNQRKDRCRDKEIFRYNENDVVYHIERVPQATKAPSPWVKLKKLLEEYRASHYDERLRLAIDAIVRAIIDENISQDMGAPFSRAELLAIQQIINYRAGDPTIDYLQLLAKYQDEEKKGELDLF